MPDSLCCTVETSTVLIPIQEKGNAKECSNYHTIVFIPHASKGNLKILQASLQQYMNQERPDVQAGSSSWVFKRQMNQRANCRHLLYHRKREFQKNISFCFVDYAKAFDCVDYNNLWKILQEMGIPECKSRSNN